MHAVTVTEAKQHLEELIDQVIAEFQQRSSLVARRGR